ncbi:conserved virulence factor C family protein [Mesobacillus maritimus]|uniref:Conserved virulence factor C family protein n=1 Tax=Mesobacillus maritimus TaxID=1643336 RepID=A0ABS7K371_9BACI|nr:conserved virulence factor C family protein [Mesobacillus maritimus]MBY0096629.1 conserved virulence factor C family protein [Mesobacillus maritimus]
MKIKSIEPTPSPNTMKINLDEELPMGKSNNYKKEAQDGAPEVVQEILEIEGVKGVYHVADFLAVERNARYDWKVILPEVRKAFGQEQGGAGEPNPEIDEHFGEIKVQVHMYKGVPVQIKLTDGTEEKRYALPETFAKAALEVQGPDDNLVMVRRWKDYGVRYGEWDEIGAEMKEELMAAYPPERLNTLIEQAKNPGTQMTGKERKQVSLADFNHPDWRVRYQLLEQMPDPTVEDLSLLKAALSDEKASIRRLATVYLGMIEDKAALPYLYQALKDKSVTVRRTAGDCLSDLGHPEAMEAMMEALEDSSKLVRWRAAMFLYEVGDERALLALKKAEQDPEFEVSLQVKLAIARIEHGEEAKGSVWKQMTEARKNN